MQEMFMETIRTFLNLSSKSYFLKSIPKEMFPVTVEQEVRSQRPTEATYWDQWDQSVRTEEARFLHPSPAALDSTLPGACGHAGSSELERLTSAAGWD